MTTLTVFAEEFAKIAEVNTSGISAEKLLSYPKPQPIPSVALEKARSILAKVESEVEKTAASNEDVQDAVNRMRTDRDFRTRVLSALHAREVADKKTVIKTLSVAALLGMIWAAAKGQDSMKKTSAPRPPDSMPGMEKLLRKRKRKTKAEESKSFLGHTLGGAGSAKFIHDWVDAGIAARKPQHFTDPKKKFYAITAGGLLGAGEFARKRIIRAREERAQETTMKKKAGVGNLGAEEVAQAKAKIITRADTRRDAQALFHHAVAGNEKDRKQLESLFVQAPGAEMPAMLAKTAAVYEANGSPAPFTDAFLDHLGQEKLSSAQRRYPELLKAATMTAGGFGSGGASSTPASTKGLMGKRSPTTIASTATISGGTR